MRQALYTLLGLSFLDLCMTAIVVGTGLATEGNPFMAFFIQHGLLVFAYVKMALTAGSIVLLWKARNSPWAVWTVAGLNVLYLGVVFYELVMYVLTASFEV